MFEVAGQFGLSIFRPHAKDGYTLIGRVCATQGANAMLPGVLRKAVRFYRRSRLP